MDYKEYNMENNKTREKLVLTKEEAREILWDGDNRFETVRKEIIETSRWSILNEIVIKRLSDGKFFADFYSVGATECQDERPWQDNEPDFKEVFPVEKTIIVYE